MNKKKMIIMVLVLLVLALAGVFAMKKKTAESYPQIAYIEDELYYGTDEKCEMVPRKMPDGVIETIVSKEIMPDSYNSANFGSHPGEMEFMYLEDGQLIIHIDKDWYYFQKAIH